MSIRKYLYLFLNFLIPYNMRFIRNLKYKLLTPVHKKYIQLSPTYECQCRCTHCGMGKYEKKGDEITKKEIFWIIDHLVLWGFGQIDFFGGEPLLDPNIYTYVNHAHRQGIFTHINTNGLLLTQDNVDKLAQNGLDAISISFDSFQRERHDQNRGVQGAFDKALKGAERCILKNIRTIMSIYATKNEMTSGNTKKLIDLAKEKGFYRVRLLNAFRTGNLSDEDVASCKEVADALNQILSDKVFVKPHGILKCFVNHKSTVYISPFGDIQPCSMVPITFGNIRNEPFMKILNRLRAHPIANIKTKGCIMNSEYMQRNFFDKVDLDKESLPVHFSRLDFSQEIGSSCCTG